MGFPKRTASVCLNHKLTLSVCVSLSFSLSLSLSLSPLSLSPLSLSLSLSLSSLYSHLIYSDQQVAASFYATDLLALSLPALAPVRHQMVLSVSRLSRQSWQSCLAAARLWEIERSCSSLSFSLSQIHPLATPPPLTNNGLGGGGWECERTFCTSVCVCVYKREGI